MSVFRFRWCGALKLRDDLGTSPSDFKSELLRAFLLLQVGPETMKGLCAEVGLSVLMAIAVGEML